MSNPLLRTPFGQVELRPVAPPPGAEGVQIYVLLPDLDELLGVLGFGLRDPILLRDGKPKGLLTSSASRSRSRRPNRSTESSATTLPARSRPAARMHAPEAATASSRSSARDSIRHARARSTRPSKRKSGQTPAMTMQRPVISPR